jgi:hypothetical protein
VSELRDDTAARDCAPAAARELPRPAEAVERPGAAEVPERSGGEADRGGAGSAWRAEAGEDWRDLGERAQGMTREEYADYMRALPEQEPGEPAEPPAAADLSWLRLGERAQGMTREEYADYMRQGPAAGGDDPVSAESSQPGDETIQDEQSDIRSPAVGDAPGDSGQLVQANAGMAGLDEEDSAMDRTSAATQPNQQSEDSLISARSQQERPGAYNHLSEETAPDNNQLGKERERSLAGGRDQPTHYHPSRGEQPESSELSPQAKENAELKQRVSVMEAKLERLSTIEERLARLEIGERDRPEATANETAQLRAIDKHVHPHDLAKTKAERLEQPRRGWSNETVGFAANVGVGASVVAADFMSVIPAEIAGGLGAALVVGASGLAWWRKRREVKDEDLS